MCLLTGGYGVVEQFPPDGMSLGDKEESPSGGRTLNVGNPRISWRNGMAGT